MTLTMKLGDSCHPYDASCVRHRSDYRLCPNAIWRRPGVVQGRLHHCGDSTIRDHGHYFITVLLQGLAANSFFSVCVLQNINDLPHQLGHLSFLPATPWSWRTFRADTEPFNSPQWCKPWFSVCKKHSFALILDYKKLTDWNWVSDQTWAPGNVCFGRELWSKYFLATRGYATGIVWKQGHTKADGPAQSCPLLGSAGGMKPGRCRCWGFSRGCCPNTQGWVCTSVRGLHLRSNLWPTEGGPFSSKHLILSPVNEKHVLCNIKVVGFDQLFRPPPPLKTF